MVTTGHCYGGKTREFNGGIKVISIQPLSSHLWPYRLVLDFSFLAAAYGPSFVFARSW